MNVERYRILRSINSPRSPCLGQIVIFINLGLGLEHSRHWLQYALLYEAGNTVCMDNGQIWNAFTGVQYRRYFGIHVCCNDMLYFDFGVCRIIIFDQLIHVRAIIACERRPKRNRVFVLTAATSRQHNTC
ncbi:hypothetical protein D3C77_397210 [compost metagenome]